MFTRKHYWHAHSLSKQSFGVNLFKRSPAKFPENYSTRAHIRPVKYACHWASIYTCPPLRIGSGFPQNGKPSKRREQIKTDRKPSKGKHNAHVHDEQFATRIVTQTSTNTRSARRCIRCGCPILTNTNLVECAKGKTATDDPFDGGQLPTVRSSGGYGDHCEGRSHHKSSPTAKPEHRMHEDHIK